MRVYLAGPLFTLAERRFMAHLRDRVGALPGVAALWPGDLFVDDDLAAMGPAAKEHIFRGCLAGLGGCGLVLAVLDGPQVDDGTAWEIGYAHARGLPVWGLRTDFRSAGDTVHSLVNCMIECSCLNIFNDIEVLIDRLAAFPAPGPPGKTI
ncbi:MAG: nucleoside 2-deoxyribosyltransferase [Solidesulfovibrio sp.]|jgi:nucleoside 2-deoxyribosyltransferase|uniref:nucleoside 2-deoxyribosyltransferase n=1 Tax=Solidesulfovibrio sp. TaxID=2910990 RepID=UPI002B205064|nr:nucleoside 2-deoxyribosyltransferase [Solidesulfovibrio sp.]MEA4855160.1 nucleoside 2-deoxyribosyltransferase [Solidesulfovibrio sp.]